MSQASDLNKDSSQLLSSLTKQEKNWLDNHPDIYLGAPTTYPPFIVQYNNVDYSGVLIDLFKLINQRLGSNIQLHIESSWLSVQNKARNNQIDGLALGGLDPEREKYFTPTATIFPTYFYIFTRTDYEKTIKTPEDLTGKRVGYKRAAIPTKTRLDKFPGVTAVPYEDNPALSKALLEKDIDAVIGWISFDNWQQHNLHGSIERSMILTDMPLQMVTHIRKDWPELVSILNKAIESIQHNELDQIMNKWFIQQPENIAYLHLTKEELDWLDKHPVINYSYDNAWAPVEYTDKGGLHKGMSAAYLEKISNILNIKFKAMSDLSWSQATQMLSEHKLGFLPATAQTKDRMKTMRFTKPYLSLPIAIFSTTSKSYIGSINSLNGKKVAVTKNYAIHEWLNRDYPELDLVAVENNESGLQLVNNGDVFAFIGNIATSSYYIGKTGQLNIRIVGETPYTYDLGIAVRDDWPLFESILQKALDAVPDHERDDIYNDWISISYQHGFDYALLWKTVSAALIILFIMFYWNRRLSHEIKLRKLAEIESEKAKKLAEKASQSKSTFLARISHDLRSPMTAVNGFADLIETHSSDEKILKYAKQIKYSGIHLLELVNQLLDISKIESDTVTISIKNHDLNTLIDQSLASIEPTIKNNNITIINHIPKSEEYKIKTDEIHFKQIMLNLLSNAIKYNSENGKITFNSTIDKDNMLFLSISDTGKGLTDEQLEHLFKAYDRAGAENTNIEGTGLGLIICKDLLNKMNGNITVKSTLGEGTTFTISLPLS